MINMHDYERYKTFTRRTTVMAVGGVGMVAALLGRMYYLQVIKAEKYTMLADENRISVRLIPPLRGKIYDRFGGPADKGLLESLGVTDLVDQIQKIFQRDGTEPVPTAATFARWWCRRRWMTSMRRWTACPSSSNSPRAGATR